MNAMSYEEQIEVIRAEWFGELHERDEYHDWAAMSVARSRGARITVDAAGQAHAEDAASLLVIEQSIEDVAIFLKVRGGRAAWLAMTPEQRRAFRDRVVPEWQATYAAHKAAFERDVRPTLKLPRRP